MTKIYILFLLSSLCHSSAIDCEDLKEGLFKLESEDGSLHTIVRTRDKQTENVPKTGLVVEYDIKWTSKCSYILFNRRVVKGTDNMPADLKIDTLYNEIIEVTADQHKVVSSFKGYDIKIEAILVKLDTTQVYKDLSELENFKHYKGTSYGGTLISDKLSIGYKQNSNDKSHFIIAFQEVLSIDQKTNFRLLDHLLFTMKSKQNLTIRNCRLNDKYDNEIVAIYMSKNDNEEAKIVKAWRFNKQTLKIEVVDTSNVKYKVADKSSFFRGK